MKINPNMLRSSLLLFFLLFSFSSFAQFSVQGVVYDRETETPLPGANVFIASTTYGVSSQADGSFKLTGLQAIHYTLVVSFVGYGTQVFDVVPGQPMIYKVYLSPTVRELSEVVVRARKMSRAEWLASLKIFKEHFLGQTENSRDMEIINPGVLDFDNHKGQLTAFTDSVLVIENRALGFRLKVLINVYEYNTRSTALRYETQMVFEALTPSNSRQERRWAKNRLEAYYGSQLHFFRSLHNDKLNEEGFYYVLIPDVNFGEKREVLSDTTFKRRAKAYNYKKIDVRTLLDSKRLLDSTSTDGNKIMNFNGDLQVNYIHETQSKSYQTYTGTSGKVVQTSLVRTVKPANFQSDGSVLPADAVQVRGYWSWELVAENLPLNYNPADDEKFLDKSKDDD